MPAAAARPSSRRRIVVAAVVIVALAMVTFHAPPANAGEGLRSRMLDMINGARERHDLQLLRLDASLSRDAMRHTRKMLRQDRIFDPPNLEEILSRYPYEELGAAAVGCDATLRQLFRSLMRSSVHRSILLNGRLRWVGIGALRADEANRCGRGSYWATDLFYG